MSATQSGKGKQPVKDSKPCTTCLREGHEWHFCRGLCVYCNRRDHPHQMCPRATHQYPRPPTPTPEDDQSVIKRLDATIAVEHNTLQQLGAQAQTLETLAYLAEKDMMQPPIVPDVPATAQETPGGSESYALKLVQKDTWEAAGVTVESCGGPGKLNRYKRELNKQAKGELPLGSERGDLREFLEKHNAWPPLKNLVTWDEDANRLIPLPAVDDTEMKD